MKQYLVIGLGRFGTSVAQTLYESNEEVLAIDSDEEIVQDCINENIVDNARNGHTKNWNDLLKKMNGSDGDDARNCVLQYYNLPQGTAVKSTNYEFDYISFNKAVRKVINTGLKYSIDDLQLDDPVRKRRLMSEYLKYILDRIDIVLSAEKSALNEVIEALGKAVDLDDIDDEDIENLLIQQIEFCNTIIFNKVDTISEEQLNKVKTIVKTLQPNAKTIDTNYGKVPVSEILNTERFDFDEASMSAGWIQALENYDADEDEHHDHDEHEHEEHEHEEHGHHHDEHEHEGHDHEGHDHHHDEHENDDHGHHGHHHHHHHHHGEGEAEEYGIGSFVYYRRKPFAKEKFEDWINDMPKGIIRSKGIIWAAENNNDAYMFEQAGKQINITNAGRWYATAPRRVRAQAMKDDPTLVKDWDEEVGDRMIKLVFIGQNLDKEAIIKSLDDCLA